ncbi:mitogen-activated protein kinase kinase kinase 20-like [Solanum lycopersicum]|uniref:Protein kinase domain-containing protein n=1 Tax=Solanum lycopersicum TaxID=4081 RepID=A0A3Q7GZB3_SOLLC
MAKLLWKRGIITLGEGSYGVVSLACTSNALFRGVTLPSLIAVKSCNLSASHSLKEEVKILRMFKHSPCTVHCYGAKVSFEDKVYLYNLYLSNCNSLPEFEVKKHTKNVLPGLSCIHNNGIIHCDNILLVGRDKTANGDVVLNKIKFEEPKFQNSKLYNEAQDFLEKCLVKNPSTRWTADMLLNHPFLLHSSKAANTAKTRKRKSGSMSLLHKPIQKVTFKIGNH